MSACGDGLDAFDVDLVERDVGAEGEAGQQGQLVGGIEAADVERRIGFGVALGLRLLQHVGERAALLLHRGQDVIAGAVEDAVDARDLVADQRLAQRLDDRDAAGDRRLEIQRDAVLLGERGELDAVLGEQRLVGGHDVLAGARALPRRPARATPSSPPISSTKTSIAGCGGQVATGSSNQAYAVERHARVLVAGAGGHADDLDAAAHRHAPDRSPCGRRLLQQAGADGAEAGNADVASGSFGTLMPTTAMPTPVVVIGGWAA